VHLLLWDFPPDLEASLHTASHKDQSGNYYTSIIEQLSVPFESLMAVVAIVLLQCEAFNSCSISRQIVWLGAVGVFQYIGARLSCGNPNYFHDFVEDSMEMQLAGPLFWNEK
jgi:hypothetical protein